MHTDSRVLTAKISSANCMAKKVTKEARHLRRVVTCPPLFSCQGHHLRSKYAPAADVTFLPCPLRVPIFGVQFPKGTLSTKSSRLQHNELFYAAVVFCFFCFL